MEKSKGGEDDENIVTMKDLSVIVKHDIKAKNRKD
jgi:hypothetical protein